jgi:hypothetical protein
MEPKQLFHVLTAGIGKYNFCSAKHKVTRWLPLVHLMPKLIPPHLLAGSHELANGQIELAPTLRNGLCGTVRDFLRTRFLPLVRGDYRDVQIGFVSRATTYGLCIIFMVIATSIASASKNLSSTQGDVIVLEWVKSVQEKSGKSGDDLLFELAGDLSRRYKVGLNNGKDEAEIVADVLTRWVGSCGSLSLALKHAAAALGYRSKIIGIYNVPKPGLGHNVLEVELHGSKVILDPTYGKYYEQNGQAIGLKEMLNPRHYPTIRAVDLSGGRFRDEFYTTREAYLNAAPIGPIAPEITTTFTYRIDLSHQTLPATSWLGSFNETNAELNDPNANIPAGFDFIGRSYMTREHKYEFVSTPIGGRFTVEYFLIDDGTKIELHAESIHGLKLLRGASYVHGRGFGRTWRISGIFTDSHASLIARAVLKGSKPLFASVDAVKVIVDKTPSKRKPPQLPTQTPPLKPTIGDDNVVMSHVGRGGPLAYNIAQISSEAILGKTMVRDILTEEQLKQRQLSATNPTTGAIADPWRLAALKWLEAHASKVNNGNALIWLYQFDNAYNDIEIKSPWASAYGQAMVIEAFIKAYKDTGDLKYRDLALRAAKVFGVPISDGGLYSRLGKDIFFEEVPIEPAPHILNGHMLSTITLLKVARMFQDSAAEKLARAGIMTLHRHLSKYDLGYWSRYDLNPRKFDIPIRITPLDQRSAKGFEIDRISIVNPKTGAARELDIGASDDAEGALRISGIDWDQPTFRDGVTVRKMRYGPDLRSMPVAGGSIQNTFLFVALPDSHFQQFTGEEEWLLKVDYFDAAPSRVMIQAEAPNHGDFMAFRTLPSGNIATTGSKTWRTAYVSLRSKDLAWYSGPQYQAYHVALLRELAGLSGDRLFDEYAERWQEYLEEYSDVNPEAVSNLRP